MPIVRSGPLGPCLSGKAPSPAGLVAGIGMLLAACQPAWAHPHVFIENQVALRFDGRRLTGFDLVWRFDEIFTDTVINQFGLHAGKAIPAAKIPAIKGGAFDNLRNYDYFIHTRSGDSPVAVTQISNFTASLDGEHLVYRFRADLAQPLDPQARPVSVGFFDHTYFVDVAFAGREAIDSRSVPAGCRAQQMSDKAHPIYDGSVYPQTVRITCAAVP